MSGPGASRRGRFLMLVSDTADRALRQAVEEDRRPCPEYLELERGHGVDLLDWSGLAGQPRGRSMKTSLRHVQAALPRLGRYDAVFSDGEHVGLPLALAMRLTGRTVPHLMLGHHVTSGPKPALFRSLTT